jgi:ElaA protein
MNWTIKQFKELTTDEVFRILQARCEVFIVEQNCPYLDPDNLDSLSVHIFAEQDGEIAAYCRITPKGTRFPEISIGRVITAKKFRAIGMGRELMKCAINYITRETCETEIRISAQSYLRKFYESFGFMVTSEQEYLEDNIPHFEMLFRKQ